MRPARFTCYNVPDVGARCPPLATAMAVVGTAGVAVAVAIGNPGKFVGAAKKEVVIVKAEAALMSPPLIEPAPRAKAVVRSAGRPGAAVDVAINGNATIARGASAVMTPLLRRWEAKADSVDSECLEMTLVVTLLPFVGCLLW